ncbi:phage baseplate protein [Bordetella pseudohinzii]|uniref:Dit-like phage tail protein N-terminal domain-containing protein n=1 Tax=Bordetella pseudohinzii TaxID=1331258 RepID=A0A0J6BSR0_9BORD|nr:hypothetical protein [Bordetella pseudohinzii]ANY17231.1 hypothetical protein BBN53_15920 [Bordetella pseudohinzii]KMM24874.1 hypothetical protein L540_03335 [Bordetella pseudohinzii]KXA75352.1 hypothetical protein AW877_20140 [Bordetella pseudohinzii]KXA75578.1 hypothetical protein AW878_19925 [Bordetella pseudohinzii]CUI96741.1 Uncharacterised protein [Bordetella pseudohinzii]
MQLLDALSTSTQQQVSILDSETFQIIFASAEPMRINVKEKKRATKFAVEDGTDRSDHVVRELTNIEIEFLLVDDTRNQFESLRQAFEQNKLVTVQTKVRSYENMLIVDVPHNETPELGTAISIPIQLQEWVEVKSAFGELPPEKVANKSQSSTVKRGQQTTRDVDPETKKKAGVMDDWGKTARGQK